MENTLTGISLTNSSNYNVIADNTTQGNGGDGIYISSNYNTVTGNTSQGNCLNLSNCGGFDIFGASYNTVTGNTSVGNSYLGIRVYNSASYNTITGNKIHNNGGSGANDGIKIDSYSNSNLISSNDITDTDGLG